MMIERLPEPGSEPLCGREAFTLAWTTLALVAPAAVVLLLVGFAVYPMVVVAVPIVLFGLVATGRVLAGRKHGGRPAAALAGWLTGVWCVGCGLVASRWASLTYGEDSGLTNFESLCAVLFVLLCPALVASVVEVVNHRRPVVAAGTIGICVAVALASIGGAFRTELLDRTDPFRQYSLALLAPDALAEHGLVDSGHNAPSSLHGGRDSVELGFESSNGTTISFTMWREGSRRRICGGVDGCPPTEALSDGSAVALGLEEDCAAIIVVERGRRGYWTLESRSEVEGRCEDRLTNPEALRELAERLTPVGADEFFDRYPDRSQ